MKTRQCKQANNPQASYSICLIVAQHFDRSQQTGRSVRAMERWCGRCERWSDGASERWCERWSDGASERWCERCIVGAEFYRLGDVEISPQATPLAAARCDVDGKKSGADWFDIFSAELKLKTVTSLGIDGGGVEGRRRADQLNAHHLRRRALYISQNTFKVSGAATVMGNNRR